jgi:CheY-like chemotaxis protein
VVALVDDLFFRARIEETARQCGVELRAVVSPEALAAELHAAADEDVLILVDLNAKADGVAAVEHLRTAGNPATVIAFLSHVQTELAARARAAGCSEVMPRSKFTRELPAILLRAKTQS